MRKRKIILRAAVTCMIVIICALYFGLFTSKPVISDAFGVSTWEGDIEGRFISSDIAPVGMSMVSDNNSYSLFFNQKTTEIALYDKNNDKYWYSNPPERQSDPIAQGEYKQKLGSQLRIEYYNDRSQLKEMDNYRHSIANNRFKTEFINDGIRVVYTISRTAVDKSMLPQVVEKERFQELVLEGLDAASAKAVTDNYDLLTLEGQSESRTQRLLQDYPMLADHDIYALSQFVASFQVVKLYDIIFGESLYTEEDLAADNETHGIVSTAKENETYVIPLEYRLKEDGLDVSIPCAEIRQPSSFTLWKISLLEFFGAGRAGEDGYLFIPDGSGSLINFNNNKLGSQPVVISMYGNDLGISVFESTQKTEQTLLPVFGVKKETGAMIGVITQGEAHSFINADISGRNSSYNIVYSSFVTRPFETMLVQTREGNIVTNKYQEQGYQGNITIKYMTLGEDNANYSGMAVRYRDYLEEKGVLKKKQGNEVPFVVELLGAVRDYTNVFGIHIPKNTVLTTFAQGREIVSKLSGYGINSLDVILTGWSTGGTENKLPLKASHISEIGSKADLESLKTTVETRGGNLYLDTSIVNVYAGIVSFNPNIYASRLASNEINRQYSINLATSKIMKNNDFNYLLTPSLFQDYVGGYANRLKSQYGVQNLSLNDFANNLYTDFHNGYTVDRQTSIQLAEAALSEVKTNGARLALYSPNAYAYKYADTLRGLPLESSYYNLTDESVPFLQIVLHGFVDFTGKAINTYGKADMDMLRAVETGAGLYYKWIYADNVALRKMETEKARALYSLNYEDWLNDAASFYNKMVGAAGSFYNGRIMSHEKLDDDVYRTTFEMGIIVVNYSKSAYTGYGYNVPPMDFIAVYKGESGK